MFNTLIESKPQKDRSVAQTVVSVVVHTAIIAAVVAVTATAGVQELEKAQQEDVQFMEAPKNEPPPPEPEAAPPPPPDVVAAPPPPKGFQVLTAPIDIPDKIPEVDLSKAITDEADFTGKGVAGGTAKGVEGGTPQPVNANQPYFEFQVEKPVLPREGNPSPRYPDMLRSANITGEVVAQFVVDTTGRAEMRSFKALSSTHEQFTAAVRSALPQMRFYAAETGGRKVRQLVQQAFRFSLQ